MKSAFLPLTIRGVMLVKSDSLRRKILRMAMIIGKGVSIFLCACHTDVNTFNKAQMERTSQQVNILGLPFHLWNDKRFLIIGNKLVTLSKGSQ